MNSSRLTSPPPRLARAAARAAFAAGLFCLALTGAPAHATLITETTEFGNTRATAQSLNGLFTPDSNLAGDNVYGVGDPTAIINGAIGVALDIDFFSFTGLAGQQYYFDVDGTTGNLDTVLGLFDSSGVLVAQGDDMFNTDRTAVNPLDPGSTSSNDAFLGVYTLKKNDTFYLSISTFGNRPSAYTFSRGTQLTRPISAGEAGSGVANDYGNLDLSDNTAINDAFNGGSSAFGNYTLNATRVSPVPEPSTYAMMALGVGALGLLTRRRRTV